LVVHGIRVQVHAIPPATAAARTHLRELGVPPCGISPILSAAAAAAAPTAAAEAT